jgi:serine/threonine-protein kinase
MALELLAGEGLRKKIAQKIRLPVSESVRIISGTLAGLAAAHAKKMIHRDLKPENILFDGRGRPKVVDFGIAKVVQSKVSTMTGSFLGTPRYASPEQAQGLEATAATDIYACGLVLYEMLSGLSPFQSETPLGYLTKHATAAPTPLRDVAAEIPAPLAAVVMRALEKDPAKRWADADAFRTAVAPFLAYKDPPTRSGKRPTTASFDANSDTLANVRHLETMIEPAPERAPDEEAEGAK